MKPKPIYVSLKLTLCPVSIHALLEPFGSLLANLPESIRYDGTCYFLATVPFLAYLRRQISTLAAKEKANPPAIPQLAVATIQWNKLLAQLRQRGFSSSAIDEAVALARSFTNIPKPTPPPRPAFSADFAPSFRISGVAPPQPYEEPWPESVVGTVHHSFFPSGIHRRDKDLVAYVQLLQSQGLPIPRPVLKRHRERLARLACPNPSLSPSLDDWEPSRPLRKKTSHYPDNQ